MTNDNELLAKKLDDVKYAVYMFLALVSLGFAILMSHLGIGPASVLYAVTAAWGVAMSARHVRPTAKQLYRHIRRAN